MAHRSSNIIPSIKKEDWSSEHRISMPSGIQDLLVIGTLLCEASYKRKEGREQLAERHVLVALYKTQKTHKFIAYFRSKTTHPEEDYPLRDKGEWKLCDTIQDVIEFLQFGILSKALCKAVGIDAARNV